MSHSAAAAATADCGTGPDPAPLLDSSPNAPASSPIPAGPLPKKKIFAFGLGHVFNDLCASCWFTYLLVLMHKVLDFAPWESAVIMLSGQIADAVATPLVGILSDKAKGISFASFYIGRRHLWYMIGTVMVVINFFCLFGRCVICDIRGDYENTNDYINLIYYSLAAAIFNVGWAAVQVMHMAMVPEMTAHEPTRVVLNSVRYGGQVFANLMVFLVLGLLIHVFDMSEQDQFHILAYVAIGVGLVLSIIFLLGTEETRPRGEQIEYDREQRRLARVAEKQRRADAYDALPGEPAGGAAHSVQSGPPATVKRSVADLHPHPGQVIVSSKSSLTFHDEDTEARMSEEYDKATYRNRISSISSELSPSTSFYEDSLVMRLQQLPVKFITYRCWLRMPEFWYAGFIYMCSRIVVNVAQVFLPFYVLDVVKMDDLFITIIPCVVYLTSSLSAAVMKRANHYFGRKTVFCAGYAMCIAGLAGMYFLTPDAPYVHLVYVASTLLGLGIGTVMVCSTQLTSDMIGSRTNYSAFVFGSFSFTDKLGCGIILFFLQTYNDDSAAYVRLATVIPAAVASALGILTIITKVDLDEWRRKHTLPCEPMCEEEEQYAKQAYKQMHDDEPQQV